MCSSHSQCQLDTAEGQCQSDGYCSFADLTCPSGQRYGDHTPAEITRTCVPPIDSPGSASSDDAADTSAASETFTAVEDGTSTTGGHPTGTSAATAPTSSSDSDSEGTSGEATGSGSDDSGGTSTGAGVGCPTAYEDFDDGEIDPAFVQAHPTELQELGGELVMTITPNDTNDAPGLRYYVDLTNAHATIELGMLPDSAYTHFTLGAYRPDNNHHYMVIQQSAVALRAGVSGRDEQLASIPFSPILHRWLRLEFEHPWVRYQNSADGVAWDTMLEVESAWVYDAGSRLELLATNWQVLTAPEQVSIRQYEICSPQPPY